jgi:predicted TIM-barrel fold metal-dependent hydrolase
MGKAKKPSKLRKRLCAEIDKIRVIDCHSHMKSREAYYAEGGGPDLFNLMAYFRRDFSDLVTPEQLRAFDSAKSADERWDVLREALDRGRNVSYWRHHLVTFRGLYGLKDEELSDGNWRELNEAIVERGQDREWYHHVLKDRCNIQIGILNVDPFEPTFEPEYATPSVRMEKWLRLCEKPMAEKIAEFTNSAILDLRSLQDAMERALQRYKEQGAVAIKSAHAYGRTLLHERPSTQTVERLFQKTLKGEELAPPDRKRFEDYMVFWLAEKAGELGLVFQIHCGMQTNWAHIPDSDPLHLCNLLRHARNTKFDLFHAGYPWTVEHGLIGKHYPNATVSMCWMYVISMEGSRRTLDEWVDLVPACRILGFGSDVQFPENVYGHLQMAKRCIADVLVKKVEKDYLSEEAAMDLARKMLRENALELFGLPEVEPGA